MPQSTGQQFRAQARKDLENLIKAGKEYSNQDLDDVILSITEYVLSQVRLNKKPEQTLKSAEGIEITDEAKDRGGEAAWAFMKFDYPQDQTTEEAIQQAFEMGLYVAVQHLTVREVTEDTNE